LPQLYPVVRNLFSVLTLLMLPALALAQADAGKINAALNGKTVASTVAIGYQASAEHPVMVNGRPAMFPAKTQIYPDGHEFFRIESGLVHADAAKYTTFNPGSFYEITKVEAKNDCLEIDMAVSMNSKVLDSKLKAGVKFMLGKGWQESMTTDAVLALVGKYLPDMETIAKMQAEAERQKIVESDKAAIAAAHAQADAEVASRASETAQAKQAAADTNQPGRNASVPPEVNISKQYEVGIRIAQKAGHEPKLGKPTYAETSTWISSKLDKIGRSEGTTSQAYQYISMDRCVLIYEDSFYGINVLGEHFINDKVVMIPLTDIYSIENQVDFSIGIVTKHSGNVYLAYKRDYDNKELADRMTNALLHASKLCESPPGKRNEPF